MTTIGVLGRRWRATVTPSGSIAEWDGGPTLDWFVAADDRWHVPSQEPTVRQTLLEGTPVVETRLRIPSGDAVQRVYAVADHGGLTVVEITNESPLPIAVAFAGAPVRSVRPPASVPVQGIDLPAGTPVFPVGHHSTLVVGWSLDATVATAPLPADLPPPLQVARGWLQMVERASRLVLPDQGLVDRVSAARCELLLGGVPLVTDDPVGFLLGVHQVVRCGDAPAPWVPEIADAVHRIARAEPSWEVDVALDAAEHVLHLAEERRGVRDLRTIRDGRRTAAEGVPSLDDVDTASAPPVAPERFLTIVERALASGHHLFPSGIPRAWWGQHLEAHRIPTGPSSTVSFALRWHGARPALLWECGGEVCVLDAPVAAPGWSTSEHAGETLWPSPDGSDEVLGADGVAGVDGAPDAARRSPTEGDDLPPISFS
jgi:hypothetical protein